MLTNLIQSGFTRRSFALQNVGGSDGSQVELIFNSVIKTYYKLQELGVVEIDGKIVFIDNLEVNSK